MTVAGFALILLKCQLENRSDFDLRFWLGDLCFGFLFHRYTESGEDILELTI